MSNLETRFRKAQNGSPKLDEVEAHFGQSSECKVRPRRRYIYFTLCILFVLAVILAKGA